jgi:hypothetical protein
MQHIQTNKQTNKHHENSESAPQVWPTDLITAAHSKCSKIKLYKDSCFTATQSITSPQKTSTEVVSSNLLNFAVWSIYHISKQEWILLFWYIWGKVSVPFSSHHTHHGWPGALALFMIHFLLRIWINISTEVHKFKTLTFPKSIYTQTHLQSSKSFSERYRTWQISGEILILRNAL